MTAKNWANCYKIYYNNINNFAATPILLPVKKLCSSFVILKLFCF